MSRTIEQLEREFPWHCAVLDAKRVALPRIEDLAKPEVGDLAIGKDGLIYTWTGQQWY